MLPLVLVLYLILVLRMVAPAYELVSTLNKLGTLSEDLGKCMLFLAVTSFGETTLLYLLLHFPKS